MQLITAIAVALLLAWVIVTTQPAQAASCTLIFLLGSNGALGNPTLNDTKLSSEDPGGAAVSFTTLTLGGPSTVAVGAPSVVYTGARPHSGDTPAVKYQASGLLGTVKTQSYTGSATSFGIGTLDGTVTTTLNAQITNSQGFPQGNYDLHTVVTCS